MDKLMKVVGWLLMFSTIPILLSQERVYYVAGKATASYADRPPGPPNNVIIKNHVIQIPSEQSQPAQLHESAEATTLTPSAESTSASRRSTPPAESTSMPPAGSTSTPPAESTSASRRSTPPAESTSMPPAGSTSTPPAGSTSASRRSTPSAETVQYQRQELSRAVMEYAIIVTLGIFALANPPSPAVINLLLITISVGFAAIWTGLHLRGRMPGFANRLEQFGVADVLAAFFGLISAYLPPSLIWLPFFCWVFSMTPIALTFYPSTSTSRRL